MMNIEAALVKEQGVTFVVVPVKSRVFGSPSERARFVPAIARAWPGAQVVLMARRSSGRVEYFGRQDVVRFLSKVSAAALPWRRWSVH